MKGKLVVPFLAFMGILATIIISDALSRSRSATAMAEGARKFLSGLTPEQRAKATVNFQDDERSNWHYIPKARKGIPLKELDANQRKLAHDFLKTGLSQRGYMKATTIMELELILRELEKQSGPARDPDLYYFSLFGAPSEKQPWGWRVEGHHLSLNFTVVKGTLVATTPSFFGSNPAEVQHGPRQGLRVLRGEEELARELLKSLNEQQRKQAVFDNVAPREIVTRAAKKVDPLAPAGIAASDLNEEQGQLLKKLLDEYISAMAPDLAAERLEKLNRAGFEKIHFAWAGSAERGQGHYYRVQGPTFLIEYDNTQNNANHIHTVWRDFNGDFGRDLLQEHRQNTPHSK